MVIAALGVAAAHATPQEDARLESCRSKLKAAQKLDLLHDLAWEKGRGPRVLVGPTYYRITIDAKIGFAETVHCLLNAGKTGMCMNFDLRDYRTGKVVDKFRNCRFQVD